MRPHASRVADSSCPLGIHVFNIAGWEQPHALEPYRLLRVDVVCSQCRATDRRVISKLRWDATPAHLRPALVL